MEIGFDATSDLYLYFLFYIFFFNGFCNPILVYLSFLAGFLFFYSSLFFF